MCLLRDRFNSTAVQKKTNDQLFVIDVTGDDAGTLYFAQTLPLLKCIAFLTNFFWSPLVRPTLPKFAKASLTSAKILAQRSAVPALLSRPSSTSTDTKRKRLTHEEKDRLLRMGKRMRRGPFNVVVDPTETGEGSALLELSEAAKQSGQYNMWDATAASAAAQVENNVDDEVLVDGGIIKRKVKVCTILIYMSYAPVDLIHDVTFNRHRSSYIPVSIYSSPR